MTKQISYYAFKNSVLSESRHVLSESAQNFLKTVFSNLQNKKKILSSGEELYRSQLGCEWIPEWQDGELIDETPDPYTEPRMRPLKDRASEGRINPKGIPYLYLSEDTDTAMSELRPWKDQLISLATFRVAKELKLIDFTIKILPPKKRWKFHITPDSGAYISDNLNLQEKIELAWYEMNKEFSKPIINTDNTAEYAPTQIIAEYVKSLGYDGIAFKSSITGKSNIVLFDLDSVDFIDCCLFETKNIKYEFSSVYTRYSDAK